MSIRYQMTLLLVALSKFFVGNTWAMQHYVMLPALNAKVLFTVWGDVLRRSTRRREPFPCWRETTRRETTPVYS